MPILYNHKILFKQQIIFKYTVYVGYGAFYRAGIEETSASSINWKALLKRVKQCQCWPNVQVWELYVTG